MNFCRRSRDRPRRKPWRGDFVDAVVVQTTSEGFQMRRIFIVLALGLLGLTSQMETASAEYVTYPWCAQYGGRGRGGRQYRVSAYQQRVVDVRGNGGDY